jgi:hypothetical protein
MAANFISSPVSSFPVILNKQRSFLIIATSGNVFGLGLLWVTAAMGLSYFWSLTWYSTSMMLLMICFIVWNTWIARTAYRNMHRP